MEIEVGTNVLLWKAEVEVKTRAGLQL